MLLLVYCVAEGPTASETLALERTLIQAALDLLSELRRVVFCKAFHKALEDNPLRAFRYGFRGIEYLNAISPELPLIDRAVIFVPRKAVCLVDDNGLELMGLSVCNESLKLWALVCSPRDMSVAVGVNYGQAPLLTELCADSKLTVDTLIGLSRAGRIACVDYCIHVLSASLLKITSLWYSRSSLRGGNRGGGGKTFPSREVSQLAVKAS